MHNVIFQDFIHSTRGVLCIVLGLLPLKLQGRIDPCHQTLGRRFLVPARTVELPRAEKPFYIFKFQRKFKLRRVYTVVFDSVCRPRKAAVFKAGHSPVKGNLNVLRKRGTHALYIKFVCVFTLRFDKYLVPRLIRKTHYLIFY